RDSHARRSDAAQDPLAGAGPRAGGRDGALRVMLRRYPRETSAGIAIVVLAAVLAAIAPGLFTLENLRRLLGANMPVLIVALGMTLVILTGQIDISVGSQFAVCSVAAGAFAKMGLSTPGAALAAILLGAAFGAINGALVAYVRIPSIVATLAS